MHQIVVFSGSAHPELAAEVCRHLAVDLSTTTIRRFSNDCLYVQLNANCRERDVFVIQPLVPPVQEHLMELLLMLDAARGASAARTTAVIPYYAYARSDKKDAPRIAIAARLVADLLVTAGAKRVLTMTLHAPQVHGFFSVPTDHLNALSVLAAHFREHDLRNTIVVAPDLGHAKAVTQFARLLNVPMAAASKQRISDDRVRVEAIVGDVDGKDVIIMDDEIATGGTIIEVLHHLRARQVGRVAGASAGVGIAAWALALWFGYITPPPIYSPEYVASQVWQYGVLSGYSAFMSATLLHGHLALRKKESRATPDKE